MPCGCARDVDFRQLLALSCAKQEIGALGHGHVRGENDHQRDHRGQKVACQARFHGLSGGKLRRGHQHGRRGDSDCVMRWYSPSAGQVYSPEDHCVFHQRVCPMWDSVPLIRGRLVRTPIGIIHPPSRERQTMNNSCKNKKCLHHNTNYLNSCRAGDLFCLLVHKASLQSEGPFSSRDWRVPEATSDATYVPHLTE